MRKIKLDKRCMQQSAAAMRSERSLPSGEQSEPQHKAPAGPESLMALQQAGRGDRTRIRSWFMHLLHIDGRVAVMAALISAGTAAWVSTRSWRGDARSDAGALCLQAFAAERWIKASVECAEHAATTGKSAYGVRAADSLLRLGRYNDALAAAQPWLGSADDAMACQVAGAAHDGLRETADAIPLLLRARSAHLARGDHYEAARDSGYLSGALTHAGRLGDALEAAEAAVWNADQVAPSEMQVRLRGRAKLSLGKILGEIGDLKGARKALWDAQQALAQGPGYLGWVFLQQGVLLHDAGDQRSAAVFLEDALRLGLRSNETQIVNAAHLNLARVRRELGELDAAELQLSYLDETTRKRATALFVEGLIAADRGHRELAEGLLSQVAARASTDDYATEVALQRGMLAERFSDDPAAERHYRDAINFVEKLRRKTDSLELRPWILERRHAPHRRLVSLLARQDRGVEALSVAEKLHTGTWLDALERRGIEGARAGVAGALRRDPSLQAEGEGEPAGQELLALLRGREALMYTETGSEIWRFHVIDGALAQLDRLPAQVRPLLESWQQTPMDRALAAELGALLIPSSARAPSQRELYIVTNGMLSEVPFAALRLEQRFLVEERAISRLPGLVALRCQPRRPASQPSAFLGDSRGDLPFAREETRAFALRGGGAAFVGQDVTVQRLEASKDAELLHLAVHADVNAAGARLLLADQRAISAADVVERQIGPRVAVLAGCATGVARNSEGWGSLSTAFLVAGSRSVVATLRSVKDEDASMIMRWFYAFDGVRQPALALARAQRKLLAVNPAAEPSSWAPFVVYGSAVVDGCDTRQDGS